MLTENDVIAAVCNSLEEMNFEIRQKLHTSEPGIDIIAVKDNFTFHNDGHRKVIGEIEYALKKLGVYVFWVKDSKSVEIRLN